MAFQLKRNAIIMAAGTSSRFVPLSADVPKGLLVVKGEVLIERQIRQLREAGVEDITIVTGYKAHKFEYLRDKFHVDIVLNPDYFKYNNTSSLVRVADRLGKTFICSSDNYFPNNVFAEGGDDGYYSALYSDGPTGEYCMEVNNENEIESVSVGGRNSWYMIGHVLFSEQFSKEFAPLLTEEYRNESTRQLYWEDVYIKFIRQLPKLKIRKYSENEIMEFDTLDELRQFDNSYVDDTRSPLIKRIAARLQCRESELSGFRNMPDSRQNLCFSFQKADSKYQYNELDDSIIKIL